MGEIADSLLNGECCEGCGEYLGGGTGLPQYCSTTCARNRGADESQVADDTTEGDVWRAHREAMQAKKKANAEWSINHLKSLGIPFELLDPITFHYRVAGVSFWPTTGKFYRPETGESGRGVRNLVLFIAR